MIKFVYLGFLLVAVTGCCTTKPRAVVEPVSINEALAAVGQGLAEMKQAQMGVSSNASFRTGLMPAEVEVNFVVSKATKQNGKVVLELAPTQALTKGVEGKVGAEYSSESSRSAGNTINVKFKSVLFVTSTSTKTETNGTKTVTVTSELIDPAKLTNFYGAVQDSGIVTYAHGASGIDR